MTTPKINPIAVRAAAAAAAMQTKLDAERDARIAAVEAEGLEARAEAIAEAERVKNFDEKRAGTDSQLWPALSVEDCETVAEPEVIIDITQGPRITWTDIDRLVNQLYAITGQKRLYRTIQQQHTEDRISAISYYYSFEEVAQFYDYLVKTAINPIYPKSTEKSDVIAAVIGMMNPYPDFLMVELYFDSLYVCNGGEAADLQVPYAECHYKRDIMIRVGFNPLNRKLFDIFENKHKI